jgi:hypothetical protein
MADLSSSESQRDERSDSLGTIGKLVKEERSLSTFENRRSNIEYLAIVSDSRREIGGKLTLRVQSETYQMPFTVSTRKKSSGKSETGDSSQTGFSGRKLMLMSPGRDVKFTMAKRRTLITSLLREGTPSAA